MNLNQLINRSVVIRMLCRSLVTAFVFPCNMCIIFGIRLTVDFYFICTEKKVESLNSCLGLPSRISVL